MLTARHVRILKAIVDEFIETAQPVGSKTLVEKYALPYSSATIRNEMAVLEVEGYLEKPHTSAGRVPSNKAYRFYVEHLEERNLEEEVKHALSSIFDCPRFNAEEAIQESCRILSDMTNLATGVLGPDASLQTLEHIQMIPINARTAVCVFITSSSHTEHKVFHFSEDIPVEDIKKCTDILNDRLKGTLLSELRDRMEAIRPLLSKHIHQHEMLFNAFLGAFVRFATDNFHFNGTNHLMYQPEFSDVEQLRGLIEKINNSSLWRQLTSEGNPLSMKTGRGSEISWIDDLAVISNEIHIRGKEQAMKLMVVGPSRMQYERVMSLLDYIGNEIEKIYEE